MKINFYLDFVDLTLRWKKILINFFQLKKETIFSLKIKNLTNNNINLQSKKFNNFELSDFYSIYFFCNSRNFS